MHTIINKKQITLSDPMLDKNLLEFIRENLDLTGTKNGCGIGMCGSCMVLVDDKPVQACRKTVRHIVGKKLLTIEGMALADGNLHPLQQAFVDAGAIQCGFCTPGMVLAAHALLLKNNQPSRDQIRKAIHNNLCRCTGYQQIVDAIEQAAHYYRSQRNTSMHTHKIQHTVADSTSQ
ncbi:MAG: 2Fe-2S iron-sulfur cluster binding domain-containing protein [Caldithrix sp.]|nr:2Fe-2S iron-sulfur cluster binding domain-containing protein [Caldithrix sp.]